MNCPNSYRALIEQLSHPTLTLLTSFLVLRLYFRRCVTRFFYLKIILYYSAKRPLPPHLNGDLQELGIDHGHFFHSGSRKMISFIRLLGITRDCGQHLSVALQYVEQKGSQGTFKRLLVLIAAPSKLELGSSEWHAVSSSKPLRKATSWRSRRAVPFIYPLERVTKWRFQAFPAITERRE